MNVAGKSTVEQGCVEESLPDGRQPTRRRPLSGNRTCLAGDRPAAISSGASGGLLPHAGKHNLARIRNSAGGQRHTAPSLGAIIIRGNAKDSLGGRANDGGEEITPGSSTNPAEF